MKTLVLYRGDYSKIKKYETAKTYKHCLFGQGIYLTEDRNVAETYRVKGSNEFYRSISFYKEYRNKEELYADLRRTYCEYLYSVDSGKQQHQLSDRDKEKAHIVYKHQALLQQDAGFPAYSIKIIKRPNTIAVHVEQLKTSKPVGYLTEFHFDKDYLLNNIYDIDAPYVRNHDILREVYGEKKFDEMVRNTKPSYRGWSFGDITTENLLGERSFYTRNLHILTKTLSKEYGVLGYRYNGGYRTGNRLHAAFSIWDEDYVNEHMVKRHF